MKKTVSIILALLLLTALTTVFAAERPSDMETVTITKSYELTNPGTVSPAETFTFSIVPLSVTDAGVGITAQNMPVPTVGSVSFSESDAGSSSMRKDVTVTLPEYGSVGIYTYTITENAGSTPGVTYYSRPIRLVVTVIESDGKLRIAAVHTEAEGEAKSDSFPNTYSAGDLSVAKTVAGNLGDTDKYFCVSVTLTGEEGISYPSPCAITGGSYEDNPESMSVGGTAQIYVRHGDTVTVKNVPYGVTYTVTEDDYPAEGYVTEHSFSDTAKTVDSALDTVDILNTKGVNVDTGIFLDLAPYLILLVVALCGFAFLILSRRRNDD